MCRFGGQLGGQLSTATGRHCRPRPVDHSPYNKKSTVDHCSLGIWSTVSRGESTSLAGRQVGLAGRQVGDRSCRELAARTSGPPYYSELDRLRRSRLSEGYLFNSFGRPEPVPVGFRGDVSISRQTMLLRGGATLMNSSRDSHGMPPPPARWTEAGVWGVVVRTEGWGWHTCVLCLRQRGRRFAAPSAAPGLI